MFVFKLQTLLDYRKQAEDRIRGNIAELDRKIIIEEEALRVLLARREEVRSGLDAKGRRGTSAADIRMMCAFIDRLRLRETTLRDAIARLSEECAAQRRMLGEAVKQRKMVEKMKEKEVERYLSEMSSRERKELDELATLRHGRM